MQTDFSCDEFYLKNEKLSPGIAPRDDVHNHFVTLIVKWTIVGGWVKPLDDKRGKVGKLECKSFVTSLERADKKTRWVGKKLIGR